MSESRVLWEYSGANEIHVQEKEGNYAITKLILYFLLLLIAQITEWIRNNKWTSGWEAMKINPRKSKAVRFTRARVKDPLNYTLGVQLIPEAISCKHLGIILRSDLSWAWSAHYTVKKAWKALHFIIRILKKGNSSTKSLAYMTLLRPILEYGAACWDPYREGQIHALDRVQNKAAKFAYHMNESNWETLSQRKIYHVYVLSSKRTLENGRGRL